MHWQGMTLFLSRSTFAPDYFPLIPSNWEYIIEGTSMRPPSPPKRNEPFSPTNIFRFDRYFGMQGDLEHKVCHLCVSYGSRSRPTKKNSTFFESHAFLKCLHQYVLGLFSASAGVEIYIIRRMYQTKWGGGRVKNWGLCLTVAPVSKGLAF